MPDDTIHRAFRYRLYPTPAQEEELRRYAGVCRLVYNLAYEQRRDFWRQYRRANGRVITHASQSAELTLLRAQYDWIASVPVEAESYALQDVDRSFANFFAGRSAFPTPRRRDAGHGFRFRGVSARVRPMSRKWATVQVPKLGQVRFRITRPIRGTVRNVAINCVAGAWHVVFAADEVREQPVPVEGSVGLDLGVVRTATLSSGEHFSISDLAPLDRAIGRAQRVLARKTRGSSRHAKQKRRIASLHARAARVRADWRHKTSTHIADQFGLVVAESLNIADMTRSAAGSVEAPGVKVAQKRGLNRAILQRGWGILRQQLAYKLDERGGRLILVDPKHTSQTCAACGTVDAKSRESQARFACVHCGHEDNADVNAAKEVLRRGTAWLDVEADVGRPLKRQPEGTQHV